MFSGDTIGKYRLINRLGKGGMGEVWLATASGHGGFTKTVVIKTLLPEYACDPLFIDMLSNEARICAKLSHPNLIEVFDFTEHGGIAALDVESSDTDVTFTTIGLRASTDFAVGGVAATARGMLGWRHAFDDTTPLSTAAFATGSAFSVAGTPLARDAAVLEAGLDFAMTRSASLGVSYDGQFGNGAHDNGFSAKLNVAF